MEPNNDLLILIYIRLMLIYSMLTYMLPRPLSSPVKLDVDNKIASDWSVTDL